MKFPLPITHSIKTRFKHSRYIFVTVSEPCVTVAVSGAYVLMCEELGGRKRDIG
jgi:hypothetical protein